MVSYRYAIKQQGQVTIEILLLALALLLMITAPVVEGVTLLAFLELLIRQWMAVYLHVWHHFTLMLWVS